MADSPLYVLGRGEGEEECQEATPLRQVGSLGARSICLELPFWRGCQSFALQILSASRPRRSLSLSKGLKSASPQGASSDGVPFRSPDPT